MQKMDRTQPDVCARTIPKRNHLLLMVAFFFLVGCVSIAWVSGGAWLWAMAGIGAALCWLCRHSGLRWHIGLAVLCFALGSLHAHAAFELPMPEAGRCEVTGHVYGEASLRNDGSMRFVLDDLTLDGEAVPGKAYCSLRCD